MLDHSNGAMRADDSAGSPFVRPVPETVIGNVGIDLDRRIARVAGKIVPLTAKEFDCLAFLLNRRGVTQTKEMFLAHLYEGREEPELKIIDVFICKIRKKFADLGAQPFIETVWGRGYVVR